MFKGALSRALLHLLGVRQIDVDYVQIYPFFFGFGRKSAAQVIPSSILLKYWELKTWGAIVG